MRVASLFLFALLTYGAGARLPVTCRADDASLSHRCTVRLCGNAWSCIGLSSWVLKL